MTRRRFARLPFVFAAVGAGILAGTGSPAGQSLETVASATAGSTGLATGAGARLQAPPCTRYAGPRGRDGSRGTKARPFRTVQRLADSLRPGQTGCLRAGVYDHVDDGYVLRVDRGGAAGAPITIRSYPGERARLVGIVTVPRGSNYVRLSGLTISGTGEQNSVKIYAANVVIQRSRITNAGRGESCMILGSLSGYGAATRVTVRRNRFFRCGSVEHENKDHAIYVSNAVGTRILRNVFWATAGYTIHFYPNARRTRVAHNTIDGGDPSFRGGVLFGGNSDYASSGNVVEYNVIAYSTTSNITSNWDDGLVGSGNVARRNCVWAAGDSNIDRSDGGFETSGNRVAPPRFVNRREHDYRLRRTSRCRAVVG